MAKLTNHATKINRKIMNGNNENPAHSLVSQLRVWTWLNILQRNAAIIDFEDIKYMTKLHM